MSSRAKSRRPTSTKSLATVTYQEFLAGIKASIRQRQYQALRSVNQELLALYGEIGEAIHLKQKEEGWGKAVVETLARDLQVEFPGRNGFSAQNLWLMRQFYLEYSELQKLQPLVGEISWAKNLVIMARIKDPLQRERSVQFSVRPLRPSSQLSGLSSFAFGSQSFKS